MSPGAGHPFKSGCGLLCDGLWPMDLELIPKKSVQSLLLVIPSSSWGGGVARYLSQLLRVGGKNHWVQKLVFGMYRCWLPVVFASMLPVAAVEKATGSQYSHQALATKERFLHLAVLRNCTEGTTQDLWSGNAVGNRWERQDNNNIF